MPAPARMGPAALLLLLLPSESDIIVVPCMVFRFFFNVRGEGFGPGLEHALELVVASGGSGGRAI